MSTPDLRPHPRPTSLPDSAPPLAHALAQRIADRTAKIGVVGLGYVGLPLLAAFHDAGFPVVGFDVDPAKPADLHRGHNYLPHLGPDLCRPFASSPRFLATTDPAALTACDAVIVCVPTPLGAHGEPDLSYVVNTGRMLGQYARPGQLVVLESTSYPGTTRADLWPALAAGAKLDAHLTLSLGSNFFVAFSPEREDPGRKSHSTRTIPKLVGGLEPCSTALATALYSGPIHTVITVSSAEVAEASKVFENVFRAVNIALVNELKIILDAMGINVWEVIEAASTKPFGFMPFFPGPGLGGHCIPIDPFYLTWKAREFKVPARFIELAGEINTAMPRYVVDRLARALNDRGRSVRNSRILILGLAYKPDIADVRESPSFELIEHLFDLGAHVDYTDPFVPRTHPMRKHDLQMESVPLTAESLSTYDAVLVSTHHSAFDYPLIAQHARLVIDTRNAFKAFAAQMGDRLVRA